MLNHWFDLITSVVDDAYEGSVNLFFATRPTSVSLSRPNSLFVDYAHPRACFSHTIHHMVYAVPTPNRIDGGPIYIQSCTVQLTSHTRTTAQDTPGVLIHFPSNRTVPVVLVGVALHSQLGFSEPFSHVYSGEPQKLQSPKPRLGGLTTEETADIDLLVRT